MNDADRRRNEREADIAKATRGPDYSTLLKEIQAAKEAAAKGQQARQDYLAQLEHGFKANAHYYMTIYGYVPSAYRDR